MGGIPGYSLEVKLLVRIIDTIVLHHTAGTGNGASIRRDHLARGWSDIYYHYVVETDGSIFKGRRVSRRAGRRGTSLELAVVGDFRARCPSFRQAQGLHNLLAGLLIRFPAIDKFYNHNQLANTYCPGSLDIRDYV